MNVPAPDPTPHISDPLPEKEPVAIAGAIQSLLFLVPAGLTVFDVWDPTEEQIEWLGLFFGALVMLISLVARGKAWAPATVSRIQVSNAFALSGAFDQRDQANDLAREAMAVAAQAHNKPVAVGDRVPQGPVGGRDPQSEGNL